MLAFFVNRMYTMSQQPPDRAGCPAFYSMEMNEMKTMKKLTALLLALTMALALTACSSAGDPTQPPETKPIETQPAADPTGTPTEEPTNAPASFTTVEEGKLHMSTNAAFPPYEMKKDDGGYEGIDVEVAEAIAAKLGLELVVDDMDFTPALLAVQNGQSDIAMAAITANDPERQKVMDFSDSYATGIQVIIVKEDSPIQTKDDLANADKIGTQDGTTGASYCADDYGEEHVTVYKTGALAIMDLLAGTIDAVVIDNGPAQEYMAANEGLKILETEYANEDYAIGFQKGNTALLEAVNAALAELKADGTFQGIVDKYIKAD